MAKLSEAQIKGLRAVERGEGSTVPARTRDALKARFLVKTDDSTGVRVLLLTPSGRSALREHERAVKQEQEQAERASRPVPGSAFVEPSARTAPVMGLEYDEEPDDFPCCSGPSVRLTPAPAGVEQEATDAEILQLLTLLDSGVKISRALYQGYVVTGPLPFRVDLDALNRAARDAVRFGLARQEFVDRLYRLSAEPIHLEQRDWDTKCGRSVYPGSGRYRVTTDPAKVTHDRCK